MKNCFFLLFFSMQLLCAQKVLVLDKSSKEIIPFANLVSDSTVVYSNENGVLDLATFNKDEYIKISAIGYKSQEMYRSKIADTILLKPIDNVLDEIVVISDKKDTENNKKIK